MIYLCLKLLFGVKPGPYFKDAFLLRSRFSPVFIFVDFVSFSDLVVPRVKLCGVLRDVQK